MNVVRHDHMFWWIGFEVSKYVCNNKQTFTSLHKVVDGENLYIGYNSSIKIYGKGQVKLLFTSRNHLILKYVYFAPGISRNFVSNPILNCVGYNLVFEADRLL